MSSVPSRSRLVSASFSNWPAGKISTLMEPLVAFSMLLEGKRGSMLRLVGPGWLEVGVLEDLLLSQGGRGQGQQRDGQGDEISASPFHGPSSFSLQG
jgi:hypothetical protein